MFGNMCDEACSDNCKNITCERDSGKCLDGCRGNFNGSFCKDCVSGMFGPECKLDCPKRCLDGICQKNSGHCITCDGHFAGAKCNKCIPGFYGSNCKAQCSQHCFNSTCDQITGNCNRGCKGNFSGDKCCVENGYCSKCDTNNKCRECESSHFGLSCKKDCPTGCANSCKISSGVCDLCEKDFFGPFCDLKCSDTCNKTTDVNICDQFSGKCIAGCNTGAFGDTCNKSCSEYCVNNPCEREGGFCLHGCTGGYDTSVCSTHLESQKSVDSKQTTIIVMGVIIALLVVAVVSLIVSKFVDWKKQSAQRSRKDTDKSFKHAASSTNIEHSRRDEHMSTEPQTVYYNVMEEIKDCCSANNSNASEYEKIESIQDMRSQKMPSKMHLYGLIETDTPHISLTGTEYIIDLQYISYLCRRVICLYISYMNYYQAFSHFSYILFL
ncbi:cell death abnormality protein 1-like [Mercenaria mercenaria]|uniref:cell death abnormality protein 1-like n=1 Tax=Mercenaria mercenaria TaxID=6596 RepID=UPI00234E8781|nr:cell death abnormality protein 1-like [Mercenaria mercenaria]